jgi:hypothetical protein
MFKLKVSNYTLSFWAMSFNGKKHQINLIWCEMAKNIYNRSNTREQYTFAPVNSALLFAICT